MNRAEKSYSYPLFSLKRLPKLLKYNRLDAIELQRREPRASNAIVTQIDMLWCNLRYGAMGIDYIRFKYWLLPHRLRTSFFTSRKYFGLIKKFDYDVFSRLIEKQNQYIDYSQFIHRKWLVVDKQCNRAQLDSFVSEHKVVIAKPSSSDCGRGVEKITENDKDALDRIFMNRDSEKYIVEEVIENCKELNSLNPETLNTVRVTYVIDKSSQPYIFSVMLRTGATKGAVIDNWGGGGILMDVSVQSGIVEKAGLDEQGNEYLEHPITKTHLIGFQVPRYGELIKFASDVASANKKVVHGGLDIAVTDNGFELIEINFPPANIGYQSFGKGYLDEIRQINL